MLSGLLPGLLPGVLAPGKTGQQQPRQRKHAKPSDKLCEPAWQKRTPSEEELLRRPKPASEGKLERGYRPESKSRPGRRVHAVPEQRKGRRQAPHTRQAHPLGITTLQCCQPRPPTSQPSPPPRGHTLLRQTSSPFSHLAPPPRFDQRLQSLL